MAVGDIGDALRHLEEENRRLKAIVADQALDHECLAVKRQLAVEVMTTRKLSQRRAWG